jgi:hypothetical protein
MRGFDPTLVKNRRHVAAPCEHCGQKDSSVEHRLGVMLRSPDGPLTMLLCRRCFTSPERWSRFRPVELPRVDESAEAWSRESRRFVTRPT